MLRLFFAAGQNPAWPQFKGDFRNRAPSMGAKEWRFGNRKM
jgi:hypothetical protein